MTAATHCAFSYLITTIAGVPPHPALLCTIFSLLPDIDHPESLIGKIFSRPSRYILKKFGHRTVTHSAYFPAGIALLCSPALFYPALTSFYLGIILSYSSHIFIDLFNKSGVKLFYPLSQKEYVALRSLSYRIPVASIREYVVLVLIIIAGVSFTGEPYSFSQSARSVAKLIYKHYDGAIADFQNNSEYICDAKIEYFDNSILKKKIETFIVLNIQPEKIYLLTKDESRTRIIMKKSEITEIEVIKTPVKQNIKKLSGKSLEKLNEIPSGSFISGKIIINNFHTNIKTTDSIKIDKGPSSTTLTLICAAPDELLDIIAIEKDRNAELKSLQSKLSSSQLYALSKEEERLKARIKKLSQNGFYENYKQISGLNSEIKKIQSRMETIRIKESSGTEIELEQKIEKLERGFSAEYELFVSI
jgi:inner membrane protein